MSQAISISYRKFGCKLKLMFDLFRNVDREKRKEILECAVSACPRVEDSKLIVVLFWPIYSYRERERRWCGRNR